MMLVGEFQSRPDTIKYPILHHKPQEIKKIWILPFYNDVCKDAMPIEAKKKTLYDVLKEIPKTATGFVEMCQGNDVHAIRHRDMIDIINTMETRRLRKNIFCSKKLFSSGEFVHDRKTIKSVHDTSLFNCQASNEEYNESWRSSVHPTADYSESKLKTTKPSVTSSFPYIVDYSNATELSKQNTRSFRSNKSMLPVAVSKVGLLDEEQARKVAERRKNCFSAPMRDKKFLRENMLNELCLRPLKPEEKMSLFQEEVLHLEDIDGSLCGEEQIKSLKSVTRSKSPQVMNEKYEETYMYLNEPTRIRVDYTSGDKSMESFGVCKGDSSSLQNTEKDLTNTAANHLNALISQERMEDKYRQDRLYSEGHNLISDKIDFAQFPITSKVTSDYHISVPVNSKDNESTCSSIGYSFKPEGKLGQPEIINENNDHQSTQYKESISTFFSPRKESVASGNTKLILNADPNAEQTLHDSFSLKQASLLDTKVHIERHALNSEQLKSSQSKEMLREPFPTVLKNNIKEGESVNVVSQKNSNIAKIDERPNITCYNETNEQEQEIHQQQQQQQFLQQQLQQTTHGAESSTKYTVMRYNDLNNSCTTSITHHTSEQQQQQYQQHLQYQQQQQQHQQYQQQQQQHQQHQQQQQHQQYQQQQQQHQQYQQQQQQHQQYQQQQEHQQYQQQQHQQYQQQQQHQQYQQQQQQHQQYQQQQQQHQQYQQQQQQHQQYQQQQQQHQQYQQQQQQHQQYQQQQQQHQQYQQQQEHQQYQQQQHQQYQQQQQQHQQHQQQQQQHQQYQQQQQHQQYQQQQIPITQPLNNISQQQQSSADLLSPNTTNIPATPNKDTRINSKKSSTSKEFQNERNAIRDKKPLSKKKKKKQTQIQAQITEIEEQTISELQQQELYREEQEREMIEKKLAVAQERIQRRTEEVEKKRLEAQLHKEQKRLEEQEQTRKKAKLKILAKAEIKKAEAIRVLLKLMEEEERHRLIEEQRLEREMKVREAEEERIAAEEREAIQAVELQKLELEQMERVRLIVAGEHKLKLFEEEKERQQEKKRQEKLRLQEENEKLMEKARICALEKQRRLEEEKKRQDEETKRFSEEAQKRRTAAIERRQNNLEKRKSLIYAKYNQKITNIPKFSYFLNIPRQVWELPIGWQKRSK